MSSKLRPLYDKLYTGVELQLLALGSARDARAYARTAPVRPGFDEDYRKNVRPYWTQYRVRTPPKYWYRLFGQSLERCDPRYIPDNLWFRRILPHFNTVLFAKALQDKCLHNVLFPDLRRPETLAKCVAGVYYDDALNLLTRDEAIARCLNAGRILLKPSVGSGQGHGINFYDSDKMTCADMDEIFRGYGQNFIIQKKQEQHPVLAGLNPKSLNTVRCTTFLYKNEVHVLSAILRVGGGGNEVDNVSQGGIQCNICAGGRLDKIGFTHLGGKWEYINAFPNGTRFEDVVVPSYDRIIKTVCATAAKMSHFKIIGWDMAVSPDGEPVLIEYNVLPGQNQETDAPTFGALTDEVLTDVFGKRRQKK